MGQGIGQGENGAYTTARPESDTAARDAMCWWDGGEWRVSTTKGNG
jgi:hypothetical protein